MIILNLRPINLLSLKYHQMKRKWDSRLQTPVMNFKYHWINRPLIIPWVLKASLNLHMQVTVAQYNTEDSGE